jgi:hypothetical protein
MVVSSTPLIHTSKLEMEYEISPPHLSENAPAAPYNHLARNALLILKNKRIL